MAEKIPAMKMAIKKDRIIDKKTADMNITTSSRTNLLTLSDFMILFFLAQFRLFQQHYYLI